MSGSSAIGSVAMVDVGCLIFSRTRKKADGSEHVDLMPPVGGIVVDSEGQLDTETGAITTRYVVLDPYERRLTLHSIDQDDVDPQNLEGPDTSRASKLIRRLDEEVFRSKGQMTPQLRRYQQYATRLMDQVIFGGRQ